MSKAGKKMLEAMQEALKIARGEAPAASIHYHGQPYEPADAMSKDGKPLPGLHWNGHFYTPKQGSRSNPETKVVTFPKTPDR